MPLAALRAFESAGKHLHMGRAGEELGVSHGAISHHIRALEDRLGVMLFRRAHRTLQLTAAGTRLLSSVKQGFDCIADGAINLDPGSMVGPLVVGCTPTIGASWILRHLGEFQQNYPQTSIDLVEIQPRQKDIPSEVEVAICYGEPAPDNEREVKKLLSPLLYPVGSPRILHKRRSITRPSHLTRFPLLHDRVNSWANWFAAAACDVPEQIREIHLFNTVLAINAARQGLGIALCNALEIENELREGQLVVLLDRAIPESDGYFLVTDESARQTVRARLFAEWIAERVG